MAPSVTLLDLVSAVSEEARGEAEVVATVVYLVNSGAVRLCGTFKGARFDVKTVEAAGGSATTPPAPDAARRMLYNHVVDLARSIEATRLARARTQRR